MYYDFSRVIDRMIYRYQRVYSHFRIIPLHSTIRFYSLASIVSFFA